MKRHNYKILKTLKERGYPNHLLQTTLQQVPFQNRNNLLKPVKEVKQTYDTFFKVSYTPTLDINTLTKIFKPNEQEMGNVPNPCLCLSKTAHC